VEQKGNCHFKECGKLDLLIKRGFTILINLKNLENISNFVFIVLLEGQEFNKSPPTPDL
jgi:hypothetical protein